MKIDINKLQEFTQEAITYCLHDLEPESFVGYLKYSLECYLNQKYQVGVRCTTSSVQINLQDGSTELEYTLPLHP